MGLIRAGRESIKGIFADQWREYFYCEAMGPDVLVTRAHKKANRRSSNHKGSDNVISDGSVVAVNEGQCMIIVDQGRIAEVCDEPGEFIYDTSTEPSIFYGELNEGILRSFEEFGRRFTFGGDTGKDQRVYFVNTREIMGNKYGTVNPVPYRVVDKNIGLDMEIAIRCHGEYSYHIIDPILFYTNVCGNVADDFRSRDMDGQMRSELLTALQTAFAKVSDMGVRYYQLTGHTTEIAKALNEGLSRKWRDIRGIEIVSFGINGVKAPEEDEELIKQLQKSAVFRDPGMAAATLTEAQAAAMKAAAANPSAGPMMAFAGMNLAGVNGGMNAGELFAMAQAGRKNPESRAQQPGTWTCVCGASGNKGNFCAECGKPKHSSGGWTCSCGAVNKGKFCTECGKPKESAKKQYKCNKCGWIPADPAHLPKFCPECGDPFDANDLI